ncbi:hypothetical protein NPIL_39591 [Nephila pilipes]|uniref:Uncharacterized protein n=1 Tax=Nephila pilipes TaxID=299642 RepID=A0A8X6R190_NEPPI|nr:hypothetical protein NPIL_39591 [Nephila pilipes]
MDAEGLPRLNRPSNKHRKSTAVKAKETSFGTLILKRFLNSSSEPIQLNRLGHFSRSHRQNSTFPAFHNDSYYNQVITILLVATIRCQSHFLGAIRIDRNRLSID